MLWNLLTCAVPAFNFYKMFTPSSTHDYKRYDDMMPPERARVVDRIITHVLTAERQQESQHLKIIELGTDGQLASSVQTDDATDYILINPKLNEKLLPWVVTRELSHVLNEERLYIWSTKAVVSSFISVIHIITGSPLLQSLGIVITTDVALHALYSLNAEYSADNFAIKHCTKVELENAVECLKKMKDLMGKGSYLKKMCSYIWGPLENVRIARIHAALQLKT